MRWRSPVLGTVLPAELLPVAEDLGLLGELGRWVLDRACRQLADWSTGGRELWLAVNLTLAELLAPDLVPRVAAVLAGYGVPAERLVLEIAESRLGADLPTVVARLAGLRSTGGADGVGQLPGGARLPGAAASAADRPAEGATPPWCAGRTRMPGR